MEKTELREFGKMIIEKPQKKPKHTIKLPYFGIRKANLAIISFLAGRLKIFGMMNPFSIALVGTSLRSGGFYICAAASALGLLYWGRREVKLKYTLCLAFLCIINFIISKNAKNGVKIKKSVFTGSTLLLSGVLSNFIFRTLGKFTLFSTVLEASLAFFLTEILEFGTFYIYNSSSVVTDQERASIAAVLAGGVVGASGIYIWGMSIKIVLAIILILIFGYKGGTGFQAAFSVFLGLLFIVCNEADTVLVFILCVSGLISSVFADKGKPVAFIAFTVSAFASAFYMNENFLKGELFPAILISGLIFIILPDKVYESFFDLSKIDRSGREYIERIKSISKNRMLEISEVFSALSKTFSKHGNADASAMSKIVDKTTRDVCKGCGLNAECWQLMFDSTYKAVFSELSDYEKYRVKKNTPLKGLSCIKKDDFYFALILNYEFFKSEKLWQSRIAESRGAAAKQLEAVAKIFKKLSCELENSIVFHENYEAALKKGLTEKGLYSKKISVYEDGEKGFTVNIETNECPGEKWCKKELSPVISRILKKRIKKEAVFCRKEDGCRMVFREENHIKISAGAAALTKEGSPSSGDRYSISELKDGGYFLALSDGMGSGKTAGNESKTAIEMLEELSMAGFETETALDIINSMLILKSGDEAFTTLDICCVDLYTGIAEFIKTGAASTFLVRGEKAKSISSSALPIGMLNDVYAQKSRLMLKPNDIILMMTDGVADIIEKDMNAEKWLAQKLGELKGARPKETAEYILEKAREKANGVIKDDMTIIAAKIWEKAG